MKQLKFLYPGLLLALLILQSCSVNETKSTGDDFLQNHVSWLADDERGGRLAGTIYEADAANYLSDQFLQFGLRPAGDDGTYIQQFTLEGPMVTAMELQNQISRNVAGVVEGQEYPDRYIIIGAHYDGQGMGGAISMNMDTQSVLHNSADDNASGTAGLLYLAREFTKDQPSSSILIVAFSGEEQGLLGSQHFVEEMDIPADSVLAMINLDMIGRLNDYELNIFGTGTSSKWDEILSSVETDSLQITTTPGGMGSSDHASFYQAEIPVLHYYTGTHDQYHRETDTADLINYEGMREVLNHVERIVRAVDLMTPSEMDFQESTDPHSMTRMRNGVTLGVMPDYAYTEYGFRIDQVQPDRTADRAGFQNGDVIIEIDEKQVSDIYDYMEILNSLESGDTVTIRIRRNGQEMELEATF